MFEKNQKKLNKNQYRTTHVKEKNILDLKEKLGWKGKGTSEDPIIIQMDLNLNFGSIKLIIISF